MNQDAHTEHELTVPFRPNKGVLTNVILLAFIDVMVTGASFSIPSTPGPPLPLLWRGAFISAYVAAIIPALACLFYRCHARLVLTGTGLHWRTWGDWRRVSWNAVADYYDLPPHLGGGTDELTALKTTAGTILLNRRWPESYDVRAWVQARATAAGATEWSVLGLRKTDTRTFTYPQGDFWSTFIIGFGLFVPLAVYPWYLILHPKGRTFWAMLTQNWKPGHLWESIIGVGSAMLLFFVYIVWLNFPLLLLVANVPILLDIRRRRQERITTRQSGITFEDGRRHLSADWDEVTGYFLQPSSASQSWFFRATILSVLLRKAGRRTYVVETKQGAFEYSAQLDGFVQLGEILKQHGLILRGRGIAGASVEH